MNKKMILHLSSHAKYNALLCILTAALLCSCSRLVIVPAGYDAALCSSFADDNISGHNIHGSLGLGGYNIVNGEVLTFPAAYIGSNRSSDGKDAIALGGFDLSEIRSNFKAARLKFYINYASSYRSNVMLFVRPIFIPWDDDTCSFSAFYLYDYDIDDYVLRPDAAADDQHSRLAVFNIRANHESDETSTVIPFAHSYKTVTINITGIIREAVKHPDKFCGLLLDPMSSLDYRYRTKNEHNEIADSGIIQIAAAEWMTFSETDRDGIRYMRNRAKGRIKYVPRIEIEY